MPDVAAALKFQKKVGIVETEYINHINSYRRESRRALLEIVDRDGVSRPAVTLMQREVDFLAKRVAGLAAAAAVETQKHVINFTRKQVQTIEKLKIVKDVNLAPVLNKGEPVLKDLTESYMTSESAWLAQLHTSLQVQSASLRLSNASQEEINARLLSETAKDGRASVFALAGNSAAKEESRNLYSLAGGLATAYLIAINETTPDEIIFSRQCVSALDERTTDCCLRAHGQIVGADENFSLDGTPRFADEVFTTPFHWYCRSTVVLYAPEFESVGISTEKMEEMAALELDAREKTGKRVEITPSHATAKRPG